MSYSLRGSMITGSAIDGGKPSRMFGDPRTDGSRTLTPMRRSTSPSKFINSPKDELMAEISSLLINHESRVVAHVDRCYQQHQSLVDRHQFEQKELLQKCELEPLLARVESRLLARQQADLVPWLSGFADRIIHCMDAYFQSQVTKQEDARNDLLASVEGCVSSAVTGSLQPVQERLQQVTPRLQEHLDRQAEMHQAILNHRSLPHHAANENYPVGHRSPLTPANERLPASPMASKDSLTAPLLDKREDGNGGLFATDLAPDLIRSTDREHRTSRGLASLFPKTADIKEHVLASLEKHRYDVETRYWETGTCQAIARSDIFKCAMLAVIVLNLIWVAIETDWNHAKIFRKSALVFQIVDSLFIAIFLGEIMVRFGAFKKKIHAYVDFWFLFDASLVFYSVWETWVMAFSHMIFGRALRATHSMRNLQVCRLLRVFRLFRAARAPCLANNAPQLWILARAMWAGLKAVLAVFCVLLAVIFIFAILFTLLLRHTDLGHDHFPCVIASMNFLLMEVFSYPGKHFMRHLFAYSWVYYGLFILFLLVAWLTLVNMLIGMICDIIATTSCEQREEAFTIEVENQTERLAKALDYDGSGGISKEEFETVIKDPLITANFNRIGVDIVAVAHFARFIFKWTEEISYSDFGMLVGQFRGNKSATIKDVMGIREYVTMELIELEERLAQVHQASR